MIGDSMQIIIIMSFGFIIGYFIFPKKWKGYNERLQIILTALLIFSMGVHLGSRKDLWQEIISIGWESIVLCVLPILASIVVVYVLSTLVFQNKKRRKGKGK